MLKIWFNAVRPWSFTAAIIPIVLGAAFAWNQNLFHPFWFLLTLVAGIAMQAGTNLINTYGDYVSGVDSVESAVNCPQLVLGMLKPIHVKWAGMAIFLVASIIGLYLSYLRGWPILVLGILGVMGGYGYTLGVAYKYKGMGSALVFFLMGPMMVWGSYYVQTGAHSWDIVWISLPVGFLVSGILHANDLRDIESDYNAGIRTLATCLGKELSKYLYYLLNLAAYISLIGLTVLEMLPLSCTLPLLLLPQLYSILQTAINGSKDRLAMLETNAAQFHFKFGSLLILGLIINFSI